MSCGKTPCPDFLPFPPNDSGSGQSIPFTGFIQMMEPEFERAELQDIRDRAKDLAVDLESGAERAALDALSKAADVLDALAARSETDLSVVPIITDGCPHGCSGDARVVCPGAIIGSSGFGGGD